jgi:hypothetical protein
MVVSLSIQYIQRSFHILLLEAGNNGDKPFTISALTIIALAHS